jgi:hypothetical protein
VGLLFYAGVLLNEYARRQEEAQARALEDFERRLDEIESRLATIENRLDEADLT